MICPRCRAELDPALKVCAQCGAGLPPAEENRTDWRHQVRETVRRRDELRRRQLAKKEEEARQLPIFSEAPEPSDEELKVRERRAAIRSRVEQKLARPRNRLHSLADAGEVPIAWKSSGALATAPELEIDLPEPQSDPSKAEPARASQAVERLGELASPGERLLSALVDLGVAGTMLLALGYLTAKLAGRPLAELPPSSLAALGCVGFILAGGYFLFFWGLSGRTIGGLLAGLRVVDRRGQSPGLGRATVRAAAWLLGAAPLGAGFVGLWSDNERRGWHDRLASTRVVRT